MLKITVNGKDYQIPTSWQDVTFRHFMEVANLPNNDSAILAYYLGQDEQTIKRANIVNLDSVLAALSFHQKDIDYTVPKKIMGYDLPANLEFETMGQYQDLLLILDTLKEGTDPKESLKKYPLIVATYTCSQAYGRQYDYNDAEKLEAFFWDAPAPEVLAIGHFTLMKCAALKRRRLIGSPRTPTAMKKSGRGSISWAKVLGSLIRYFSWRVSRLTRGTS